LGAMLGVAVSLLASATLLPALIGRFGTRVVSPGWLKRLRLTYRRRPREDNLFWRRWTEAVMRHPVISVLLSGGLLLLIASPVLHMHTGIGALSQFPPGDETVVGARAAASVGQPGAAQPLHVVVQAPRGAVPQIGRAS